MDLLNLIKEYWTILAFIGVFIMSWQDNKNTNKEQDRKIEDIEKRMIYTENKLESHMLNSNKIQEELNRDIAIIKTTLEYIKEAIEELKSKKK